MAFELTEYPPRSFCEKYRKFLAPKGSLLPPQQALKNKNFGPAAAETLKKAFKITIKKLRKMRSACAACDKKEGEPDWLGDVEGTHAGGGNLILLCSLGTGLSSLSLSVKGKIRINDILCWSDKLNHHLGMN